LKIFLFIKQAKYAFICTIKPCLKYKKLSNSYICRIWGFYSSDRRIPSSAVWRCINLVWTVISEERRLTRDVHGAASQKMVFFKSHTYIQMSILFGCKKEICICIKIQFLLMCQLRFWAGTSRIKATCITPWGSFLGCAHSVSVIC
jgi:hypothetical protein